MSNRSTCDYLKRSFPALSLCNFGLIEIQKIVGSTHDAVTAVAIAQRQRHGLFDERMSRVEESL